MLVSQPQHHLGENMGGAATAISGVAVPIVLVFIFLQNKPNWLPNAPKGIFNEPAGCQKWSKYGWYGYDDFKGSRTTHILAIFGTPWAH